MKRALVLMMVVALLAFTWSCKSKHKAMKEGDGTADLQETYWKLVELNGVKMGPTPADKRETHIKFRTEKHRVEGFGGCNSFNGSYKLMDGNRISISKIAATQMACMDMNTETSLFKVLEMADNYTINGTTLSLNKDRMAPLARFEAMYFK